MSIKKIGDLKPGDYVPGTSGRAQVTRVHPKHIPESMFRLEFDNGEKIEASGNHLWYCESSIDRSIHNKRIKEAGKVLKGLSTDVVEELLEFANSEQKITASVGDMLAVLDRLEDVETAHVLVRIAESLGPVAEETITIQDELTGDNVHSETEKVYDARLFSQQVLALFNRKYRKKWSVVVGKVVTTEQLIYFSNMADIPEISPLNK